MVSNLEIESLHIILCVREAHIQDKYPPSRH